MSKKQLETTIKEPNVKLIVKRTFNYDCRTGYYKHFNRFITKSNIYCTTHKKGYPLECEINI